MVDGHEWHLFLENQLSSKHSMPLNAWWTVLEKARPNCFLSLSSPASHLILASWWSAVPPQLLCWALTAQTPWCQWIKLLRRMQKKSHADNVCDWWTGLMCWLTFQVYCAWQPTETFTYNSTLCRKWNNTTHNLCSQRENILDTAKVMEALMWNPTDKCTMCRLTFFSCHTNRQTKSRTKTRYDRLRKYGMCWLEWNV